MRLQDLTLLQFKNYEEARLELTPHVNCIAGPNGAGKTNLLDAIHYLSMSRSAFTPNDQLNIRQGDEWFMVRGTFVKEVLSSAYSVVRTGAEEAAATAPGDETETASAAERDSADPDAPLALAAEAPLSIHPFTHSSIHPQPSTHQITLTVRAGQKKILTHNKVPYERVSEHIGRYPVVFSSPYDTDLIREGSEERRKFFDSLLSQLNPAYLHDLMLYTHLLKQRNSLLKQFAERQSFDRELLHILNEQLVPPGHRLAEARLAFLQQFGPLFQQHYQYLAQAREEVTLEYKSQLPGHDLAQLLHDAERKDLVLQRSTVGPHRDDVSFLMDGLPVKQYGSQGQQKSFVIALKLAQFEVLAQQKGFKPLLLLDDIFDRLDETRIAHLLELVAAHTFGQLFITDTHPGRAMRLLGHVAEDKRSFWVEGGHVRVEG